MSELPLVAASVMIAVSKEKTETSWQQSPGLLGDRLGSHLRALCRSGIAWHAGTGPPCGLIALTPAQYGSVIDCPGQKDGRIPDANKIGSSLIEWAMRRITGCAKGRVMHRPDLLPAARAAHRLAAGLQSHQQPVSPIQPSPGRYSSSATR